MRKLFGGRWTYSPDEHVWTQWNDHGQRHVYRCAKLAPRYDGDDDSFTLEYRWYDTGEVLYGMGWLRMVCNRPSRSN